MANEDRAHNDELSLEDLPSLEKVDNERRRFLQSVLGAVSVTVLGVIGGAEAGEISQEAVNEAIEGVVDRLKEIREEKCSRRLARHKADLLRHVLTEIDGDVATEAASFVIKRGARRPDTMAGVQGAIDDYEIGRVLRLSDIVSTTFPGKARGDVVRKVLKRMPEVGFESLDGKIDMEDGSLFNLLEAFLLVFQELRDWVAVEKNYPMKEIHEMVNGVVSQMGKAAFIGRAIVKN
jgi:hypothetical protein